MDFLFVFTIFTVVFDVKTTTPEVVVATGVTTDASLTISEVISCSTIVVSNKMQKTIVVKVESRYAHPMYSKTMAKTRKYLAHDEMGDVILVTKF